VRYSLTPRKGCYTLEVDQGQLSFRPAETARDEDRRAEGSRAEEETLEAQDHASPHAGKTRPRGDAASRRAEPPSNFKPKRVASQRAFFVGKIEAEKILTTNLH